MALRGRHIVGRSIDNSSFLEEINVDKEKKKTFKFDFVLLICVLLLSGFGLLVIYSATMFSLSDGVSDPAYYFKKQLTLLLVSIFIFGALLFVNYRRFKRFWIIVFVANVLLLISVLIFGYEVNATKGWIDLKFTSIQPSEFAKIFMIICVAAVLSKWRSEKKPVVSFKKVILSIFIAFLTIGLILLEPDFGQSIIIFIVFVLMLFVSGANFLYVLGVIGVTISGVFAGLRMGLIKQYQLDRLLIFLRPDVKPEGAGYNLFQSKIAIGSGKLFGKGLFLGTQTNLNYVPEHRTDFIFSVIGEEFGFIGAFITIIIFAVIIWRCFKIARQASDQFGFLLSAGVGFLILTQMTINIGMTIGLMPIIGIPLPFLSYGGSNLLSVFIGISLVENVYMRREIRKDYEIANEEFK